MTKQIDEQKTTENQNPTKFYRNIQSGTVIKAPIEIDTETGVDIQRQKAIQQGYIPIAEMVSPEGKLVDVEENDEQINKALEKGYIFNFQKEAGEETKQRIKAEAHKEFASEGGKTKASILGFSQSAGAVPAVIAGMDVAGDVLSGNTSDLLKKYYAYKQAREEESKAAFEEHPIEFVGGALTGAIVPGGAIKQAVTLAGKIATGLGLGALSGFTGGEGQIFSTKEGETFNPEGIQRVGEDVRTGAAIGGALPLAMKFVAEPTVKAVGRGLGKSLDVLSELIPSKLISAVTGQTEEAVVAARKNPILAKQLVTPEGAEIIKDELTKSKQLVDDIVNSSTKKQITDVMQKAKNEISLQDINVQNQLKQLKDNILQNEEFVKKTTDAFDNSIALAENQVKKVYPKQLATEAIEASKEAKQYNELLFKQIENSFENYKNPVRKVTRDNYQTIFKKFGSGLDKIHNKELSNSVKANYQKSLENHFTAMEKGNIGDYFRALYLMKRDLQNNITDLMKNVRRSEDDKNVVNLAITFKNDLDNLLKNLPEAPKLSQHYSDVMDKSSKLFKVNNIIDKQMIDKISKDEKILSTTKGASFIKNQPARVDQFIKRLDDYSSSIKDMNPSLSEKVATYSNKLKQSQDIFHNPNIIDKPSKILNYYEKTGLKDEFQDLINTQKSIKDLENIGTGLKENVQKLKEAPESELQQILKQYPRKTIEDIKGTPLEQFADPSKLKLGGELEAIQNNPLLTPQEKFLQSLAVTDPVKAEKLRTILKIQPVEGVGTSVIEEAFPRGGNVFNRLRKMGIHGLTGLSEEAPKSFEELGKQVPKDLLKYPIEQIPEVATKRLSEFVEKTLTSKAPNKIANVAGSAVPFATQQTLKETESKNRNAFESNVPPLTKTNYLQQMGLKKVESLTPNEKAIVEQLKQLSPEKQAQRLFELQQNPSTNEAAKKILK